MTEPTPVEVATPSAPSGPPTRNTLGLVALGLAVVGALFAVIPPTNGFSWLFLLAGFIVAIVGLTRKGQGKLTSIVALVVSFLFWIISIFVGLALVASGISNSIDELDDAPSISEPSEEAPTDDAEAEAEEPSSEAGIGDTVTTPSGAEVTLVSIDYGVANPNDIIINEVRGALSAVKITMVNNTDEAIAVSGASIIGFIGDARYEASAVLGDSGDWYIFEEINPGLSVTFTAFVDVPADAALDRVEFQTSMFLGESAVFAAR